MAKKKPVLPPGPNPRGDLMTEKDQKQLRRAQRKDTEEPSARSSKLLEDEREDLIETADLAEGERKEEHSRKVKPTPGQAEGDRETVEREIRAQEHRDHP